MPSDASFNDKHHQWQLTRRQLISRSAAAGVAIAAPGFLSACGGDGEGEGEGDDGKAKAEQFADQHIADHMGDAALGISYYEQCVHGPPRRTRPSIQVGGRALPLAINSARAIDAGGFWTNELLLSAPLTAAATQSVVEAIRARTGDDISKAGAAFGYQRFLDVGTSKRLGRPLLAHADQVIVTPNVPSIPVEPKEPPEGTELTPYEMAFPRNLYLVSRSGIRTLPLGDPPADPSLDRILEPRKERVRSYLNHLIGTGPDGEIAYASYEERPVKEDVHPELERFDAGELSYSEASLGESESAPPDDASTDASSVRDAPTARREQKKAGKAGSLQTTRQALDGTPGVSQKFPPDPVSVYGPIDLLPPVYASCSGTASADGCQGCAQGVWLGALGGNTALLTGCLYYGVPAAAAACGPFGWICGPAAALGCLAVAAAAAILINAGWEQSKRGCMVPFTR